jgi:DNA ligase-1
VIGHEPGTGRHRGRLGAQRVELPNGVQFSVGSGFTDRQREQPPAIGTSITFRYQELSERGVPRFPTWQRFRRPGDAGREAQGDRHGKESRGATYPQRKKEFITLRRRLA